MLPRHKNSFVGKAKKLFHNEHDKVNNIPLELDLKNLVTTHEIWAKGIHIYTPNHTVQGVHIVQYDDGEDDSCPLHSLTSE